MRCANCDRKSTGTYCTYCGQKRVTHLEPTMHDMVHEATHEFLHVDGKIFQTLRLLFTKPGMLTAEFLSGRRAKYIGPLRLYLTASVIYFILASFVHTEVNVHLDVTVKDDKSSPAKAAMLKASESKNNYIHLGIDENDDPNTFYYKFFTNSEKILNKNPEVFAEKFKKTFPKVLFVLVPLFASILWLSFLRNRKKWMSYLYFSLHFHAAAFGALILTLPFRMYDPENQLGQSIWFVWLICYLAFATRRVWGDGTARAFVRSASVMFVYGIFFLISLLGAMAFQLYLMGAADNVV